MQQGTRLLTAGRPELALLAFEKAATLQPGEIQCHVARAVTLTRLQRHQAAYQALLQIEDQLLTHADGACNLAIAAETCGDQNKAEAAYARALELDPRHPDALNNTALRANAAGQRDIAIERAKLCVAINPSQVSYFGNLSDYLCGARRYAQALEVLDVGLGRFPRHPDLLIRRIAALAFSGDVQASQALRHSLDPKTSAYFDQFLHRALKPGQQAAQDDGPSAAGSLQEDDAWQLFCDQAFTAMMACDWADNERLTALLKSMVAEAARNGRGRDWRNAQLYGLMLDITEDEMALMRRISIDVIGSRLQRRPPPLRLPAGVLRQGDERIRIGLAVQSQRDERQAFALARQLSLHDSARFAIHIYSPTPQPLLQHAQRLLPHAASVVEIAHMSDLEVVGRIRLDQLDVFMDMAFDTPWCRPEIVEMRVAPVQLRQLTWHRHHPPRPCDYNLSDAFVHPPGLDLAPYGPVVRLPHSCWLATLDDQPPAPPVDASGEPLSREARRRACGVQTGTVVLTSSLPSVMLDPASFALWMELLRELPHAVLWLPAYNPDIHANLQREAAQAGVDGTRLVFSRPMRRPDILDRLSLADLFIDTLRFNANQGLVDALRMGVPAVTCAGQSMSSRLGGSIVRSAGLPDGVTDNPQAFKARVLELARDQAALTQMREKLLAAHATAPLFDLQPRVREWEAAWAYMVERHRAGLAPVAFDVASRTPAAA